MWLLPKIRWRESGSCGRGLLRFFAGQSGEKHVGQRRETSTALQLGERSLVHQAPAMQQAKPVAHTLGFIQPVRTYDHRFSVLPGGGDVVKNYFATQHVEAARRLVEQDRRRVVNE